MTTRHPIRIIVALVTMLLVGACAARPGSEGGFVSGDGSITRIPAEQRAPAPRIDGTTLEDRQFDSAAHPGTVLVYNVWGSWCAPCRKEAPALVAASRRLAGKASFVGINTRDLDRAPATAFVRAFKVPYPNLYDPDARLLLRFAPQVPASAIPSTLVIDSRGRVAARILGEATEATLVGLVEEIAGEG